MGAWLSSLKCPPQLPIQIEIVTEVLGDTVQWASCLCLKLAIQQTSGRCGMQYVVLDNTIYLPWFQAQKKYHFCDLDYAHFFSVKIKKF